MNVHNPYIRKWNQTYYLYYMGTTFGGPIPGPGDEVDSSRFTEVWNRKRIGLATAPSIFGPWTRCDEPLIFPETAPTGIALQRPILPSRSSPTARLTCSTNRVPSQTVH